MSNKRTLDDNTMSNKRNRNELEEAVLVADPVPTIFKFPGVNETGNVSGFVAPINELVILNSIPIPNKNEINELDKNRAEMLDTIWLQGTCLENIALTPADYYSLKRFYDTKKIERNNHDEIERNNHDEIKRFTGLYCYIRNKLIGITSSFLATFPYLSIMFLNAAQRFVNEEKIEISYDSINKEFGLLVNQVAQIKNQQIDNELKIQLFNALLRKKDELSKTIITNKLDYDPLENIYNYLGIHGPYTQDLTHKRLGGKRKSKRRKSRKSRKTMRKNTYKNNMRNIQLNVK